MSKATCPRCGLNRLITTDQVLNALSRRDSKTYICNECGNEEALIDIGYLDPTEAEKLFVKNLKETP